ncbi:MAG: Precorrin-6A reductase [Succiniclasticum sp.]|jgi:precorrin-6A/cobalt-precorrin-6A reductase
MKKVVWLVAGTSEGRRLAGALADLGVTVHVTVATEYGASLYPDRPNIHVYAKRMTYDDMCAFLREKDPELVLDSSHPYAKIVTETVHRACTDLGYEYKRMLRPSTPHPDCIDVHNFEEAVEFLSDTEGPIFLTTGSKNLVDFAKLPGYQERVTCRILPLQGSLENALSLGYPPSHIICMQGPFSKELNVAMFRQCGARYIVSKDTGKAGGFEDKVSAAAEVGAKLVLIDRIPETGEDLDQVLADLQQRFG